MSVLKREKGWQRREIAATIEAALYLLEEFDMSDQVGSGEFDQGAECSHGMMSLMIYVSMILHNVCQFYS